jgi:hypothetical protein
MTTIPAIRSPYDLVHMNAYWTWTAATGTVTGHFDTVTTLTDGCLILSGTCVDEYGWWHGPINLDFATVADLRRAPGYREPEPAPFPVTVNFEWRRGLIRLAIPDDACRRLRAWKVAHWTEIPGVADGYSADVKRGTWEHRAMSYLHSVQSHVTDSMPFIEGETLASTGDQHGNGKNYDLLLSTCGIASHPSNPSLGLHFRG